MKEERSPLTECLNKIKSRITLEHCVIRLVMAWCFVSIFQTLRIAARGQAVVGQLAAQRYIGFGWHVLTILVLFVLFFILFERLDQPWVERIMLFAGTFSYAIICALEYQDLYFGIGMSALMVFTAAYCLKGVQTQQITMNVHLYRAVMIGAGVLFVVFTGGCTVARYLTYAAPNYDLGLFSQMFYNMKTHLTMNTTCERDMLLSHMRVHLSPAFWLILPFYALVPSPATLQVMQAVVIALGLIPLAAICRNHHFSRFETMLLGIGYVSYPVLSGGCFYDIHENMFLPLFILCLLYYMEKDSWPGILLSMALLFSVKEDAAVYAAFIALYMLLGRKMYRKGTVVLAASVLYFMFATALLSAIGEGAMVYRFDNMIDGESGSMLGIVKTVLSNPAYLMTQVMNKENLEFLLRVFAPLCFLPFLSKRWQRFILFGPLILFNLMSDYPYFHNIFFQYVFGSGTLLFYVMVLNIADFKAQLRSRAVVLLAAAGVLLFGSVMWEKTSYIARYRDPVNRKTYAVFDEALSMIPEDASVTATTFLCPALSKRPVLYELYYTDKQTAYVALDLRTETTDYDVNNYLGNDRYETVYYEPSKIAVFKDRTYTD